MRCPQCQQRIVKGGVLRGVRRFVLLSPALTAAFSEPVQSSVLSAGDRSCR